MFRSLNAWKALKVYSTDRHGRYYLVFPTDHQHLHWSSADGGAQAGGRQAARVVGVVCQVLRGEQPNRRRKSGSREGNNGALRKGRRPRLRVVRVGRDGDQAWVSIFVGATPIQICKIKYFTLLQANNAVSLKICFIFPTTLKISLNKINEKNHYYIGLT